MVEISKSQAVERSEWIEVWAGTIQRLAAAHRREYLVVGGMSRDEYEEMREIIQTLMDAARALARLVQGQHRKPIEAARASANQEAER